MNTEIINYLLLVEQVQVLYKYIHWVKKKKRRDMTEAYRWCARSNVKFWKHNGPKVFETLRGIMVCTLVVYEWLVSEFQKLNCMIVYIEYSTFVRRSSLFLLPNDETMWAHDGEENSSVADGTFHSISFHFTSHSFSVDCHVSYINTSPLMRESN